MSSWAEGALVVIAAVNVLGLVALVLLAFGVLKQLRSLNEKSRSVLERAERVLDTVQSTAATVRERADKVSSDVARRAERITELSEQVAERVAQRVDTTSAIVQDAVVGPLINLASLRAGVGKGLEVWQELTKAKGGNGK